MQEKIKVVEIINLTPHEITFLEEDDTVICRIPPSGKIARLIGDTIHKEWIRPKEGCLPIEVKEYNFTSIENLPPPQKGKKLFVSTMIVDALKNTDRGKEGDLICPGETGRDENGRIIGIYSVRS